MPVCRQCGVDHDADALVRHERSALVFVHCPDCNRLLGTWRDPARR
jgi:hypothetical protein